MTFTKRHISTIALCIYMVTVCILCFFRPANLPDREMQFLGIGLDKIVHFIMFSPFPVLVYFSLFPKAKFIIFLVGCVFALCTEYIQGLTEYRSFERGDLIADILGLSFGSTLTLIHSILKTRKDNDK